MRWYTWRNEHWRSPHFPLPLSVPAHSNEAGQEVARGGLHRQAAQSKQESHNGVLLSHAQIARKHQRDTNADCSAVDGRNDGLGAVINALRKIGVSGTCAHPPRALYQRSHTAEVAVLALARVRAEISTDTKVRAWWPA